MTKRPVPRSVRQYLVTPMDGTHTVVSMLDAGEPVGPSLLSAAQNYVKQWGGEVPPHWRHDEREWWRRARVIADADAGS